MTRIMWIKGRVYPKNGIFSMATTSCLVANNLQNIIYWVQHKSETSRVNEDSFGVNSL